jgi:hypothetical protein
VKRTQIYVEEALWQVMTLQARRKKTSVSEIIREAVREKYWPARRKELLKAMVGLWRDRHDIGDASAYVRKLRNRDRRSEPSRR